MRAFLFVFAAAIAASVAAFRWTENFTLSCVVGLVCYGAIVLVGRSAERRRAR